MLRPTVRTDQDRPALPTGTVTFMFTDVEGSTGLLHAVGDDEFREMIERHQALIDDIVRDFGGIRVATEGDSVFAVFPDPLPGVRAALGVQRTLESTAGMRGLKVRIGLHTGNATLGGDNYIGVDVHRASRISNSAHGGQIVISDITARLVEDRLGEGTRLKSLGRYRLAGFPEPTSLHQLLADGLPEEFPPLRAQQAVSQLPAPLTDFVGRESEIDSGLRILEEHRVLTLTGPGGTGKTRLAIEIARRCEHTFADGAFFVALASLVDSDLIPMTILETLGLKTAGGVDPLDHLTRHLTSKSVLLILDNYEQLIDGAGVVSTLLSAASTLSVIVTSRSPLRVRGERELPVPPLGVPEAGDDVNRVAAADGVRLFVSRAEAVRPDFVLDERNVETVSSIARALDGLPLAIELAASRVRSLTPELLLERLGNQLLASRSSDLPARQQTIVNAISWSYDLLDDESRKLFEQLSVFSGSFGLDEAEIVCRGALEVLDGVTQLVEQSLLRQFAYSGQPRFRMLTVIREFAFAALAARGEDGELLNRHAAVYLALAARADAEILTSRQGHWLSVLSQEHDNLRAAFDHAVATGDASTALGLVGSLWRFWQMRGHLVEGRRRAETALAMPGASDPVARARALTGLGGIRYWQGDWRDNLEPYEQALELFRRHGSEADVAEALYNMSFPLGYLGGLDRAESLLEESLEVSQRIGRIVGVGRAHWGLGDMATFRKDWSGSIRLMEKAVEVFSGVDAPFDLGWSWFMLAYSQVKARNAAAARLPLRRALEIFGAARDMSALALILDVSAMMMVAGGESALAGFFIGASHRLKADTGVAISDVDVNQYPEVNEFLETMDGEDRAGYEEGYNASLDEVVEAVTKALAGPGV